MTPWIAAQSGSTPTARSGTPVTQAKADTPHYENILYLGLLVGGIVLLVVLVKWAASISKWVFAAVLFLAISLYMAHSLYYRTEPAFLTPLFDVLAEFFPTVDYVRPER
jgi:hypothetical protein